MAGRQGSNSGGRGQSRALSRGLAVEPEPMVSLAFVKNDSYEKGPDAVVVHVYVKEIRREASRVLFREQDFTLVFQTRWAGRRGQTGGDLGWDCVSRFPPALGSAGTRTS